MARTLLTLFGLALLALGIWLAILWWPAVKAVILGLLTILIILLGLILFILGISEIGARQGSRS
ncbi:MAG TPA: hypothetical protein VHV83_01915 [Armatimonadota bacterium]|nr:hypothetical protein [Armatimonadota bacterium]